ncbi:MAG: hypothetical protein ACRDLN_02750 [Solirubrobacteraceae bacterium]
MTFPRTGHPVMGRALLAASVPLIVAGAFAAPASAGVVDTPNACKFSYDNEYRTQSVEVTASAPAEVAAGQQFTLSGEKLEVKLRLELARDAAAVGLIPSDGTTVTVVTKTWIALRGTNTREGTRVVGPLTVSATTSALYDQSSQTISATPFAYTPPKLPDTTWTGSGGDIAFSQAGGGAITAALGQLPVGGGGSDVAVQGSAVIQANLPGGANFFMDCQPGTTNVTRPEAGAGTTFNPLLAGPFATVAIPGAPSNPSGTPPPAPKSGPAPAGRIASTKLVARGARLPLRISCPAGSLDCAGTLQLRTRAKVRIGRRAARIVTLTRPLRYKVAKGASRTITVSLSANGRALLRRRSTYKVTLTLKPATGRAVTRSLTLRRG